MPSIPSSYSPSSKMRAAGLAALLLTAIIALFVPTVSSQTANGRIQGSVRDQTDAALGGATVTVTDTQRGVSRALTTDASGEYNAPNLVPGVYAVRAEAKGFKTVERRGIGVEVARELRVDMVLQPGDTSVTVNVTEEAALVDSTSAVLGGTLSNQTINDLPLQGRNFTNLLQLRPGVANYIGGGAWTQSTNGLRPEHNVYIVDGLDDIEPFSALSVVNDTPIAGDSSSVLPIDAIQEFNTQENPKAEYGWKPGAIVNVGIKSGTNTVHGSAYAFGRDDAMDARNPFIPSNLPKQVVNLEQYGATVGGPIRKDKIFFFGGYESQTADIGNAFLQTVPTTAAVGSARWSLTDACQAVLKAGKTPNPLSLAMAGLNSSCGVADPKANLFQAATDANVLEDPVSSNTMRNFVVKIDDHINDHNSVSGSYFFGNNTGLAVGGAITQDYWRDKIHTRSQLGGGSWVWTPTSNLVNEVKFGFNRTYQPTLPGDCDQIGQPSYSYLHTGAQSCGFPFIQFTGFSGKMGCCKNFPKYQGPDTSLTGADVISYLRGRHAFKFGGELRKMIYNGATYRAGRGVFWFANSTQTQNTVSPTCTNPPCTTTIPALQNFMAGAPQKGQVLVGDPVRHLDSWNTAAYFQDDWRVLNRLTLNLGLRYEYTTPISEANNLLGNFDPAQGLVQVGKQISQPYHGDHNNFAPRFGFAWDVTGKGSTVVRGGGSIMYVLEGYNMFVSQQGTNAVTTGLNTVPTGAVLSGVGGVSVASPGNMAVGSPTITGSQLNWSLAGPIFPTGQISCSPTAPCPMMGINQNIRNAYVEAWNVGIQHSFTSALSLDLTYVGNHGVKLWGLTDMNQPPFGSGANLQIARPYYSKFPYLSNINYMTNLDGSNYHGLQATLTQRPWHGLSYTMGFTWSHALDIVSNDWNTNVPTNSFNPGLDYGPSNFDMRERYTMSLTYALPEKKGFGQMLQGWRLNSVLNVQSALPWSVVDSADDYAGTGEIVDRWNFFGNPADFSGMGAVPIAWFPGKATATQNPNPACVAKAAAIGATSTFNSGGCFVRGSSMLLPPAAGTIGNLSRNMFRGNGHLLWDMSVTKNWKFNERITGQFRLEGFNILNHTQYANPMFNGAGGNDPTNTAGFGAAPTTPDVANNDAQIGSGADRSIQLGFKIIF